MTETELANKSGVQNVIAKCGCILDLCALVCARDVFGFGDNELSFCFSPSLDNNLFPFLRHILLSSSLTPVSSSHSVTSVIVSLVSPSLAG